MSITDTAVNGTDRTATDRGADRAASERGRAVDAAILSIEKQFGRGSIMKLGSSEKQAVDSIPTFYAARLHLARGYQKLGDRIKARQEFESVSNSSNNPTQRTQAAKALQELDRG